MLGQTWFIIPDAASIQAPMTGSRPGDPNADVLFTFVLTKVLKVIHKRAAEQGIELMHNGEGGRVSDMVTWVDDIALSVTSHAEELTAKVSHLLSIVQDTMLEHGLSLSYGAGKTAVMLSYHGESAVQERQRMEQRYKDGIPLLSEHKGQVLIPIVAHYKHLGGFITRNGSRIPELRVRIATTMQKLRPLRKILVDKRVDEVRRGQVVKAIGLSTFTLHAGTLFALSKGEFQVWQAGLHKIYQTLHDRDDKGQVQHLSFYEMADALQSPMPMELLHLQRLRMWVHILRCGDDHMIAAILENFALEHEDSWLQGLYHSLRWMAQQVGHEHVPHELFQLNDREVWTWFQPAARDIKKLISKAEKSHLCKVKSLCGLQRQAAQQDQLLREMGWTRDEVSVPTVEHGQGESFHCDECEAQFSQASSLAVHQQRKHRQRVALRRVIVDGACRACGRYYHTRPRLLKHLQCSTWGCWQYHLRHYEPMTLEQAAEYDEQDLQNGTSLHQQNLKEHGLDKAWRWCSQDELRPVLPQRSEQDVIEGEPTEEELHTWRQLGMLPPGQGGRSLTKRKQGEFPLHHVSHETASFEKMLMKRVQQWHPDHDWVPRPMADGRKFFIILFSGHRRFEDMASQFWWMSDIIPICLDVAIDAEYGNVLKDGLWKDLIRSRKVVGGHGGPPCETYSLARWLDNEGLIYPRPLRNCDQPWGMDGRTLRETFQWMMGNILMWRTLYLLLSIFAHGGSFTLEHPKGCGGKDNKWTIWDSAFIAQLLLSGHIRCWTILQGPLGQPFSKPTNLLAARMNGLGAAIYESYDKKWRPTMTLGGREAGSWRTSRAKAYPAALCRVLAQQHILHAQTIPTDGHAEEPEGLEDALRVLCETYDPYLESAKGTRMCADFEAGVFSRHVKS